MRGEQVIVKIGYCHKRADAEQDRRPEQFWEGYRAVLAELYDFIVEQLAEEAAGGGLGYNGRL